MANESPKATWQKVLNTLEVDLSPAVFSTFLKTTTIEKSEKGITTVLVKDRYQKENLELRYYAQIKAALDDITGTKNELIFKVASSLKPKTERAGLGPLFREEKELDVETLKRKAKEAGLAPFYTFANFVVGSNNNLAHAVARAIVDKPGALYNPLFIYSGVGLGKTHLIQAIGNEILRKHQNLTVVYCTGESFMNELIESITEGRKKTFLFRRKFRAADVWIIDDVQFIAGRESTQEEFFNTFNALYQDKRQVILASDRPPKEIPHIEERLSSRFAAGMIARMDPPDLEMRVAILRNKRQETGFAVSDEVLETVASLVRSNIRELEGALLQVVSAAATTGKELNKDSVREILETTNGENTALSSPKKILNAICDKYDVRLKDLKSPTRKAAIALPRQICMYLLRQESQLSLEAVGELLGGRDHTTILHGVGKIENLVKKDKKLAQDILNLSTNF